MTTAQLTQKKKQVMEHKQQLINQYRNKEIDFDTYKTLDKKISEIIL